MLSMSPIADDPRVRRMGDYLDSNGWRVIGLGLPGAKSAMPAWAIHEAEEPPSTPAAEKRTGKAEAERGDAPRPHGEGAGQLSRGGLLTSVERQGAAGFLTGLGRAMMRPVEVIGVWIVGVAAGALGLACLPLKRSWSVLLLRTSGRLLSGRAGREKVRDYLRVWRRAQRKGAAADDALLDCSPALQGLDVLAQREGVEALWIANDWVTLSVAAHAVEKFGGLMVYDSHEFAVEEFAEHLDWRIFQQPLVKTIEARHIGRARVVTSVSPGITRELKERYGLTAPTATLRNLPWYEAHEFRPTGDTISILYHGVVSRGRGLAESIEALTHLPSHYRLTIRGPGGEEFRRQLLALADELQVAERVSLEAAIPTRELVQAASTADIGLMCLPGHSRHNEQALPNKVFEYLMAGLAICVSDLPAMAEIVKQTGAGVLIADHSAKAIADAILSIDRSELDVMKQQALEAAKTLHFEADAKEVLALYESAAAGVEIS